jgi:hypothetical protein
VDGSTIVLAFEQTSQFVDRVVGHVLDVYDHERAGWLRNRSAVPATRVRSILDGGRSMSTGCGQRWDTGSASTTAG